MKDVISRTNLGNVETLLNILERQQQRALRVPKRKKCQSYGSQNNGQRLRKHRTTQ